MCSEEVRVLRKQNEIRERERDMRRVGLETCSANGCDLCVSRRMRFIGSV